MASSYIVAGCRTPIGKYLGGLSGLRSVELGGHAIAAVVERAGLIGDSIDQVIMGQVIQAGAGQAPARQSSTLAGLPATVGAATVNKVCGSGLFSVMLADMAIRAGEYRRVIAGGMESMSQAPHLLQKGRTGWKYGDQPLLDSVDIDGLHCAQLGVAMGCVAEWVAKVGTISRAAQDQWAMRSHQRASAAAEAFATEIVPIPIKEVKTQRTVSADEGPRADCTLETLARLKPAFSSSLLGDDSATYQTTVTAGNASTLSDGAAAVAVVDQDVQQNMQTPWAFRIVGHCHYADAHQKLFTAPVGAIRKLLTQTKANMADIDLFEINEAFAAQMLACIDELSLDAERVNIRGGSIALGHPLGCSGSRVLVTLIHNLVAHHLERGVAALCLGGGESVAMLIERAA